MTTYDFGFHHDLVFVCELVLWQLLTELVYTLLLVSYLTCFVASGLFPPCSSLSHLRCVVVEWDKFHSSLYSHSLMALTLVTRLSAPQGDTDKVCSSAIPTKFFYRTCSPWHLVRAQRETGVHFVCVKISSVSFGLSAYRNSLFLGS
jgi:hypothetical protein